jgi:1-acyl-sn-glycerol-3-phosphate acyltransferase
MQKLISYPLSIIFYGSFLVFLLIFHPIQWICFNVFGYQAHKKSVDYLNFFLACCGYLVGTTYKVENINRIPKNTALIFVANHQGMYDIIPILWFFRRFHCKFISKKELGKGIPSVSYNLRNSGAVLIDRKDSKQAIPAIKKLAEYIERHKRTAVIFPEGTRSKTGVPIAFSQSGLKVLCKYAPSAYIVPITINNSWKMFRYGYFPLGLGSKITFTVHEPMAIKDFEIADLLARTESKIKEFITN